MDKHLRLIITLLLVMVLGLAWYFEYPIVEVYLVIALAHFAFDFWDLRAFRQRLQNDVFIKCKSRAWLDGVVSNTVFAFLIYQNAELNLLLIITIAAFAFSAVCKVAKDGSAYYQFTSDGVINLNTGKKFIKKEDIIDIHVSEDQLAIDTKNFRNDFRLKKMDLIEPIWEEALVMVRSELFEKLHQ